nr:hypothetical protein Itr_chr13CG15390 [Ipomoea trifida]
MSQQQRRETTAVSGSGGVGDGHLHGELPSLDRFSWSTTTPSNGDGRATTAWMQQQQALATKFPAVLMSGHRGENSDVQAGGRTSCNDGKW